VKFSTCKMREVSILSIIRYGVDTSFLRFLHVTWQNIFQFWTFILTVFIVLDKN
jgi:hypothetical protein